MASVADSTAAALRDFHREVENRARKSESGEAGLAMLQHQLGVYTVLFEGLVSSVKESISADQRNINRKFVPVIRAALGPAYEVCKQESGQGCFQRMKNTMHNHVQAKSPSMFQVSVNHVKEQLLAMIQTQEQTLQDGIDEALVAIHQDYLAALGCNEVAEAQMLPASQKIVPADIMKIIDTVMPIFQELEKCSTVEKDSCDPEITVGGGTQSYAENGNAISVTYGHDSEK
ncbi:MAG: hypothetical protein Q9186_000792 [Xanthomendoza sp. 1 TL-2023]